MHCKEEKEKRVLREIDGKKEREINKKGRSRKLTISEREKERERERERER